MLFAKNKKNPCKFMIYMDLQSFAFFLGGERGT